MNAKPAPSTDRRPVVLMAGPMPSAVGGMVEVAALLMGSALAERFSFEPFPINATARPTGVIRSVMRHLARLATLAAIIVRRRVALVHLHTCSGFTFYRNVLDVIIARLLGAKVVLHIHGGGFEQFVKQAGFAGSRVIRIGLTIANRVIVLSPYWRRMLADMTTSADVRVVPNGVVVRFDSRGTETRAEAGEDAGRRACRFLFLGPMTAQKGIDVLNDACRRLARRNVRFGLDIAGPADTRHSSAPRPFNAATIASLQAAGCDVALHGVVVGPRRNVLIEQCDCLVLPSRSEALPMVILEAGARGKAVIATDVGAVADILGDVCDDGLVPPDDAEALASAMLHAVTDRQWVENAGAALRERVVARFSLQRQSAQIEAIYDEVLDRGAPARRQPMTRGAA